MFEPILDCWYLTGPTASGKSLVGLELAEILGAEIISLDSMAVYRGMDIGTAKPTWDQRRRVPHHLLDVVDPNQEYSLAEYLTAATELVGDIRARGKQVLFVGGTPLYLKSLLRGVVEGPPADPEFRREVEQEVAQVGIEALRQRLHQVDPLAAAKLHPHDQRRMIRALEVYRATGQPISHYQMQFDQGHPAEECRVFVLSWPREVLHRRINDRVDTMFREGIMNEVRRLLEVYQTLSETAMHAVGYREVLAHFAQRCDREAVIEQTKARTRRFARRQETWFRGLSECRWIWRDGSRDPRQLAGLIATQAS